MREKITLFVPIRVSIAVINTRTTISLGRKGLFPLATLRSFSITEDVRAGAQGRKETDTDAESMEHC